MVRDAGMPHDGAMTDQPTFSPPATPFPPPPPPTVESTPGRLGHPVALFVVAVIAGLGAALATGIPAGFLAAQVAANDCSPSDPWCGLGAALAGLFIGGLVALGSYIVAGVTVIRNCRSAGRRAAHVVSHLVSPLLLILLAIIAGSL
jgi:hypothetical protein